MYNTAACINYLNEYIKLLSVDVSASGRNATLDHCVFSQAALRGDVSLVNIFIPQRGILEPDITGYSALYHAFANGHYAIAKTILSTAVARGESCYREFCRALEEPRYLCFLFDHGADVVDSQQLTPLDYAKREKNTTLINKLTELRTERLRFGDLAFYHAIESNDVAYTHYLLSQPGLTAQDLRTPLSLAAAYSHLPLVTMLCQHPVCDVTAKDNAGITPLEYAMINRHFVTVLYLLKRPKMIESLPIERTKLLERLQVHFKPEQHIFEALKFALNVISVQTGEIADTLGYLATWILLSCQLVKYQNHEPYYAAWHSTSMVIIQWLNSQHSTQNSQQLLEILENARAQPSNSKDWLQGLAILSQFIRSKVEQQQPQPEQQSTVQLTPQP